MNLAREDDSLQDTSYVTAKQWAGHHECNDHDVGCLLMQGFMQSKSRGWWNKRICPNYSEHIFRGNLTHKTAKGQGKKKKEHKHWHLYLGDYLYLSDLVAAIFALFYQNVITGQKTTYLPTTMRRCLMLLMFIFTLVFLATSNAPKHQRLQLCCAKSCPPTKFAMEMFFIVFHTYQSTLCFNKAHRQIQTSTRDQSDMWRIVLRISTYYGVTCVCVCVRTWG